MLEGSNVYHYAGNGSLSTNPWMPTPTAQLYLLSCQCKDSLPDGISLTHCQKKATLYTGDEINDAVESEGPHFRV